MPERGHVGSGANQFVAIERGNQTRHRHGGDLVATFLTTSEPLPEMVEIDVHCDPRTAFALIKCSQENTLKALSDRSVTWGGAGEDAWVTERGRPGG
jgi:hypothetical protein